MAIRCTCQTFQRKLIWGTNLTSVAGGSADPNMNTVLANILKKAKISGVPKDNIEKAIARVCSFLVV